MKADQADLKSPMKVQLLTINTFPLLSDPRTRRFRTVHHNMSSNISDAFGPFEAGHFVQIVSEACNEADIHSIPWRIDGPEDQLPLETMPTVVRSTLNPVFGTLQGSTKTAEYVDLPDGTHEIKYMLSEEQPDQSLLSISKHEKFHLFKSCDGGSRDTAFFFYVDKNRPYIERYEVSLGQALELEVLLGDGAVFKKEGGALKPNGYFKTWRTETADVEELVDIF